MAVIVHAKLKKQMIQSVCVKSLVNKKVVNVIVDYMLKSNDERIVINDYIENDPLSENNLDKTLYLVNEFRLSKTQNSIWLYTGYVWEDIMNYITPFNNVITTSNDEILYDYQMWKRQEIIKRCNVLIDGQYIDSRRDITLSYRGSSNQRLIDIQQSLQKGEIVLWQT